MIELQSRTSVAEATAWLIGTKLVRVEKIAENSCHTQLEGGNAGWELLRRMVPVTAQVQCRSSSFSCAPRGVPKRRGTRGHRPVHLAREQGFRICSHHAFSLFEQYRQVGQRYRDWK